MKNLTIPTFVTLCLLTLLAHGQEREIPRTSDGRPDLQGIWTNATQTPLQRPSEFGNRGSLNEREATELEASWRNRIQTASAPSDPDRAPPTDGNTDLGYNNFWVDRGTNVIDLGGEYRTSIIVDPADGRIPMLEGRPQNDLRSQFRAMPGIDPYHG
ncbi:MAG: hypothetical protein KJN90_09705, partial [Gammaproteobacteria bacterium]|nr:hypothetical protein [Gammaproteobacteria bacterium]